MSFKSLFFLCLCSVFCFSQEDTELKTHNLDASLFYGSVLLHNPDISHLITDHPTGVILNYSRKSYGTREWESEYNYPDFGYSFIYQDMNNETLGEHFGLYAYFNFYFFKRNLQLSMGQGIAYNTNPYDKETNFRNNAYGSKFLSSNFILFNYSKENVFRGLGFKAGISLIHYSNGSFKAPNTSTNTMALTAGVIYNLDKDLSYDYIVKKAEKVTEPIKFNLQLRTGLNESDIIGLGQYGFLVASIHADKRLGRKSAIQLGVDGFYSNVLKEVIRYQSIAFPENGVSLDNDHRRVGVFVGHELFINKMSFTTQLGYYVYYPTDFEGRLYNRIGLKRYFGDKLFGEIGLKAHAANAEAIEFGVGIRL